MKPSATHVVATQTENEDSVQNYLIVRGKRYAYRRRIPLELVEHYGRREITKALGTSDHREAARLARALAVQHDQEFDAVRRQSRPEPALGGEVGFDLGRLDLGEANDTVPAQESSRRQIQDERPPSLDDLVAIEAVSELARIKQEILRHRLIGALGDYMTLERLRLGSNRAMLSGEEPTTQPLWKLRGTVLAQQEILEPGQHPPVKWLTHLTPTAPDKTLSRAENRTDKLSLEHLVELWRKDGSHTNVRTIEKAELVVRRFKAAVGDLQLPDITRKHCISFRDRVLASGKSIATTNDHMDKLRALLAVAKSRDLIQQNPAEGCVLKDPVPEKEKRKPFDVHALVQIFSSPVYRTGFRPAAGAGEAAYWLPLLALFTGGRLEELGQLHPNDLHVEQYTESDGTKHDVWVLRFTDAGAGQRLKNPGSRRRVPLHPELIRLGFVEFVDGRRERPRIFYELQEDTRGRETGLWSKWFGRWLRSEHCGVTDKRMVFHSFRHTFKDLCRQADIQTEVSDALTGHSGEGGVARVYGSDQYPLRPLVLATQKVRLPAEVLTVVRAFPVRGK